MKFDSKKWLEGDLRLRGRMALELQSNNVLIGKTQQQIVVLLGEPTLKINEKMWEYSINTNFTCYFFPCGMQIYFDKNYSVNIVKVNNWLD